MRTTIVTLFMLASAFLAKAQTKSENLFYLVDRPESFESFKNNIRQISIVCPQTFLVSKEGVVSGSVDQRILDLAKKNDVKVVPLVVNSGFNSQLLHDIVSNPLARQRSIEMMITYAKELGLAGWQFDLEGLNIRDKDFFMYRLAHYYS